MSKNTEKTKLRQDAPMVSGATTCSPCICLTWASIEPYKTNHHPNCKHVDDSLIDVWFIHSSNEGDGYYTDNELVAHEAQIPDQDEHSMRVKKSKMHREIYDKLPDTMSI